MMDDGSDTVGGDRKYCVKQGGAVGSNRHHPLHRVSSRFKGTALIYFSQETIQHAVAVNAAVWCNVRRVLALTKQAQCA